MSAAQVAEVTGLSAATAHRILKTLQSQAYLEQDPQTRAYSLGIGILKLASNIADRHNEVALLAGTMNQRPGAQRRVRRQLAAVGRAERRALGRADLGPVRRGHGHRGARRPADGDRAALHVAADRARGLAWAHWSWLCIAAPAADSRWLTIGALPANTAR